MNIHQLSIIPLFLCLPFLGKTQEAPDSAEVKQINPGYYTINTFHNQEDTTFAYGADGWMKTEFIPKKSKLSPNGLYIVFSKNKKRLALYAFANGVLIQEEHHMEGYKIWEKSIDQNDGSTVEKFYWGGEKLRHLISTKAGKVEHFRYSEDGTYLTP